MTLEPVLWLQREAGLSISGAEERAPHFCPEAGPASSTRVVVPRRSEDSAHVAAIGLALEPLAWPVLSPRGGPVFLSRGGPILAPRLFFARGGPIRTYPDI